MAVDSCSGNSLFMFVRVIFFSVLFQNSILIKEHRRPLLLRDEQETLLSTVFKPSSPRFHVPPCSLPFMGFRILPIDLYFNN